MAQIPNHSNNCHDLQSMLNIITTIDANKNFADYDWDNDGKVDVCFVSIGLGGAWGVNGQGLLWPYETNDNWYINGVYQGKITVDVTAEIRCWEDEYRFFQTFVHEMGHNFFGFSDQDHSCNQYHDHFGLGSFDVMSNKGFNNQRPSPYSPPLSDIEGWVSPVILSNNSNFVLEDYQYHKKLYKYMPATYSNTGQNQRFYLSYIVPNSSDVFGGFPTPDPTIGGLLVWHVKGDAQSTNETVGNFSNWKYKDLDLEYADGKYNWDDYRYKLDANPLSGRDKLDVRKMTNNVITGGSFWDYSAGNYTASIGDQSAFYLPGDGKSFGFYSNPTSNLMNLNENYDENILSGLSVKNLRYENGQVKAAIKINDYSISQNTTLPIGKWYFNNTLTVDAGVTLTIQPGTELYFSTNANLIVNGTLNAVGTSANRIKFDKISTSSNWNGISMGNGSSGNIQYCDIKNANYGFSISYVSPLIKYCNISNNSVGISLSYWANPTLVGNTISNNTSHGIACYYYSSPRLNDYYSDSNVIKDNGGCGVSASYNSNPVLSKGSYSNGNSIKNNSSYEVSANSNCSVDATNVWWNVTTSPYYYTSDFFNDYSSTISISPARSYDPNPGRLVQSNPEVNNTTETISLSMQSGNDDLASAIEKQKDEKYDEAISLFLDVFKNNKDVLLGRYALCKIEECFTQAGKKDYLDYSKKEIKPLLKEGTEHYVVALELETHQIVNAGLYKEAVNNLQLILKKYNLNSAIEKNTLFTLGAFYSLYFGDKDNADKYFGELRKKYPKDELVNQIEIIKAFGTVANGSVQSAEMISFSEEVVTEIEKEISQDMASNYPNPFNPTTKISFSLKESGRVSLKVYDVLGKEVANLAEGFYEAGKHVASFDGSNLASGIYFYRLTTPAATITKKMMLVK